MGHLEQKYSIYPSKPYSNYQFSTSPGGYLFFFFVANTQHNSNINPRSLQKKIYLLQDQYICIYVCALSFKMH